MCVSQLVPILARVAFNLFLLNFFNQITVDGLKCYTDVEGKQISSCNELEGFRTCFTKYNDSKFHPSAFPFGIVQQYQEATVIGRGCSTKDKVFYRECETHSYGDSVEKMCFCSFMLCNSAPAASPQVRCSSLVTLLALTAFWTIFYSLQGHGDDILCSRSNNRPDPQNTSGGSLCSLTGRNGSREKWQMRRRKRRRKVSAKLKSVDLSLDQLLIPNSAPGCYSSSIVRMRDGVSCQCSLKLVLRLVDQKLMLPPVLSEIRWHSSTCNCDVLGSPIQTQVEPTQTSEESPGIDA
ncbi:uncharacterized protein LOC131883938 [Tigriopus californicus]|uniref:uncharacterized protein LOC131883938 n=1 Tax=Tigriopus californicus TaxID=6832 RepID=UPI0027DA8F1D|nr:uncharacterized protein LOC131883938 [Tigriopus californicus]